MLCLYFFILISKTRVLEPELLPSLPSGRFESGCMQAMTALTRLDSNSRLLELQQGLRSFKSCDHRDGGTCDVLLFSVKH